MFAAASTNVVGWKLRCVKGIHWTFSQCGVPSNFHQGKLMTNNTEASQRSSMSRQAVLIMRSSPYSYEARLAKSLHFDYNPVPNRWFYVPSSPPFYYYKCACHFFCSSSRHERHFPTPDYVLQEFIFLEILKKRYATLIEVQEILRLDCTSDVSLSVL